MQTATKTTVDNITFLLYKIIYFCPIGRKHVYPISQKVGQKQTLQPQGKA